MLASVLAQALVLAFLVSDLSLNNMNLKGQSKFLNVEQHTSIKLTQMNLHIG